MRVSSSQVFDTAMSRLQQRQVELSQSQERLASGKKVGRPSDDPLAAARAEIALSRLTRIDAQQRAVALLSSRMDLTESVLADAGELILQAREQLIGVGSATFSEVSRDAMIEGLRSIGEQLNSLSVQTDASGSPLFGEAMTSTEQALAAAFPNSEVWQGVPDPLDAGVRRPVIEVINRAIEELRKLDASGPEALSVLQGSLSELESTSDHLMSWRSRAGVYQQRAELLGLRLEKAASDSEMERSLAEDVDLVQAMTEMQTRQTAYDAALKTYAMVQRLSLFDQL